MFLKPFQIIILKAAIYKRYGGPDVISIRQVKKPAPGPQEILIEIHASTVNRTDCGFRSAQYVISRLFSGLLAPKNKILGCEFSGIVAQIGQSVSKFKVGDYVFGYDDKSFGGHAEYKVLPEQANITHIPAGLDFIQAAAMTEGSHYALSNIRAAGVKDGDNVLVYGATGAIGSAAVQLLKFYGAYVLAVANTKNIALIQSLGADQVIDYQTQDFLQTQQRFDFVFDAVGKSSFTQCAPLLKPKGIYISTELGKRSENIRLAITTRFSSGKRVLFPIPKMEKQDLLFLSDLTQRGAFKPVIDKKYALDDIVEAHRYVEMGNKTGNVSIVIR